MTRPNCEQMLKMLLAIAGPDPAELELVRTETAVVFPEDSEEQAS